MFRQRALWLTIGLLVMVSLACNAFAGAGEPAITLPPPPTAVVEPTVTLPVGGEETEAIAPTATLSAEEVTAETAAAVGDATVTTLVDLNVRSGPGVGYDRVSFMLKGESAPILGQDPATGWWKVVCPPRAETNECWVSGGAQYTVANNSEGVPVAAAPPTPTPIPPTAEPDADANVATSGLLVYESDGRLWAAPLDFSQEPPVAGEETQLAEAEEPMIPAISPDGQNVAYLVDGFDRNELHVVDVDGSDDRILVASEDIPITMEGDVSDMAAFIGAFQWLADSQAIAFTTYVANLVGPGTFDQEDLWTVTLAGVSTEQLPPGKGGGLFALSRNNQVIASQPEAIIRTDLDGDNWEVVINFDFVNTASEYAYLPSPQWAEDGSQAFVAIPSAEPFTAGAEASLWRIPTDGPAELQQALPGNILFGPVFWSADGASLAYVRQITDGTNPPPTLVIADGDGNNQVDYATGDQLVFYGWSFDGGRFLYAGDGFYAVGQAGSAAAETAISERTADARWLSPLAYVVAIGSMNDWSLYSRNLSGDSSLLASSDSDFLRFDVWSP